MKKLLLILICAINVVFAIPSVSEIKMAMQQNNSILVEHLAKEVLLEKPNSAKAHYFLGQAYLHENKKQSALNEFRVAQQIDSKLSFATNPAQFNMLLNSSMQNNVVTTTQTIMRHKKISHRNYHDGINILAIVEVLLCITVVAVLIWMIIKSCTQKTEYITVNNYPDSPPAKYFTPYKPNTPNGGANEASVANISNAPASQTHVHNYNTNPINPANPLGIGGNGFVTGLMAGVVLDEVLSHENHSYHNDNYNNSHWDNSESYETTTTTYANDSSSDNWDSGSDNSWSDSSSDFDCGSSSDY